MCIVEKICARRAGGDALIESLKVALQRGGGCSMSRLNVKFAPMCSILRGLSSLKVPGRAGPEDFPVLVDLGG